MEWAEIAFSWPFGKVKEENNNVSLNRSHHVANLLATRCKISRDASKLRTPSRGKSKRHSKEIAMPQQGSRVPTARKSRCHSKEVAMPQQGSRTPQIGRSFPSRQEFGFFPKSVIKPTSRFFSFFHKKPSFSAPCLTCPIFFNRLSHIFRNRPILFTKINTKYRNFGENLSEYLNNYVILR